MDANGELVARSLKLRIELIPQPLWYRNLRNLLPDSRWKKLSQAARAGGKCEICGSTDALQCDERYEYDDANHVQQLVGLRCVCRQCHEVMNFGRTQIVAAQYADRYPTLIQDTIVHFMKVNGVDQQTFNRHATDAFARWRERSAVKDWTIDYGSYAGLVHEVAEMRAQRKSNGKSPTLRGAQRRAR